MTDDKQGEGFSEDAQRHGEETTVIPPLGVGGTDDSSRAADSGAATRVGTPAAAPVAIANDGDDGTAADGPVPDGPVPANAVPDGTAADDAGNASDAASRNPLEAPDFDTLVAPVELPRHRPPAVAVIGAAIAVVVVIALIVTLVVVRPFGSVRASDYSEGTKRTVAMQRQYEKTSAAIDDALGFLYTQGVGYDAAKADALKTQAAKLRESAASFADLRANKDTAVAAAYASYVRQADRFADMSANLADSAEALSMMNDVCGNTPSGTVYDSDFTAQYEQYIASCRTSTESLAKAKAKVVSEFSGTLTQSLDQMAAVVDQIKALGDISAISSGSDQAQQLQELSAQLVDLDASSGAINDFQDKLRQSRENANPSTLLQKLNAVLKQGYEERSK